jgi:hypothetical protein
MVVTVARIRAVVHSTIGAAHFALVAVYVTETIGGEEKCGSLRVPCVLL